MQKSVSKKEPFTEKKGCCGTGKTGNLGIHFVHTGKNTGNLPKHIEKFLHRGNFEILEINDITVLQQCCYNLLAFVINFELRDISVMEGGSTVITVYKGLVVCPCCVVLVKYILCFM